MAGGGDDDSSLLLLLLLLRLGKKKRKPSPRPQGGCKSSPQSRRVSRDGCYTRERRPIRYSNSTSRPSGPWKSYSLAPPPPTLPLALLRRTRRMVLRRRRRRGGRRTTPASRPVSGSSTFFSGKAKSNIYSRRHSEGRERTSGRGETRSGAWLGVSLPRGEEQEEEEEEEQEVQEQEEVLARTERTALALALALALEL